MINRYIPYGYRMENAQIIIIEQEAAVVRDVFRQYKNGASLKEIALDLTLSRREFLPGRSDWNKNRVSRLLADEKYQGNDLFPAIIHASDYEAARAIRSGKRSGNTAAIGETVTEAAAPILCGACGGGAKRLNFPNRTYVQKHVCRNPNCRREYLITDERMTGMVLHLLQSARICLPEQRHNSLEARRLENEIQRLLDTPHADSATIRELIFDLAAEKYRLLTEGLVITDKLRTELAPANLSSSNIRRTVMETVQQITLIDNDTIEITLINGQVLKKEQRNGTDKLTKEGADHSANRAAAAGGAIA